VVFTHANLLWATQTITNSLEITKDDCYISLLSLAHVSGQILALYVSVLTGMTVYYVPEVKLCALSCHVFGFCRIAVS